MHISDLEESLQLVEGECEKHHHYRLRIGICTYTREHMRRENSNEID
jgi:hypothetical protein